MNEINLKNLDLNLLYTLHILLEEKNVTRTALRLALSQSAISHSLRKLRTYFNDPLLVKTRRGMVPTAVAEELRGRLRLALEQISDLKGADRFDPALANGTIRIAASDYGAGIILPRLIERLSKRAPGIKIDCSPLLMNLDKDLENGFIDIAFGGYKPLPDLSNEPIFYDRYIGLAHSNHPLLKKKITKEILLQFKHSFIKVQLRTKRKDDLFKTLGIEPSKMVQIQIPYHMIAPFTVERNDLILIMPEMGARLISQLIDVKLFELPVKTEKYPYYQTWHPRRQEDQLHKWLRTQVKEVCKKLERYYKPAIPQ